VTVEATSEGYAELVEFANNHATLLGLGDRRDQRSRRRPESAPAGELGDPHRGGPSEAGRPPQRCVRPAGCDQSRA
jgi:hypothetical protein